MCKIASCLSACVVICLIRLSDAAIYTYEDIELRRIFPGEFPQDTVRRSGSLDAEHLGRYAEMKHYFKYPKTKLNSHFEELACYEENGKKVCKGSRRHEVKHITPEEIRPKLHLFSDKRKITLHSRIFGLKLKSLTKPTEENPYKLEKIVNNTKLLFKVKDTEEDIINKRRVNSRILDLENHLYGITKKPEQDTIEISDKELIQNAENFKTNLIDLGENDIIKTADHFNPFITVVKDSGKSKYEKPQTNEYSDHIRPVLDPTTKKASGEWIYIPNDLRKQFLKIVKQQKMTMSSNLKKSKSDNEIEANRRKEYSKYAQNKKEYMNEIEENVTETIDVTDALDVNEFDKDNKLYGNVNKASEDVELNEAENVQVEEQTPASENEVVDEENHQDKSQQVYEQKEE